MNITVTNIYTHEENPHNKRLKTDLGQAFYIMAGDQNILFDTGVKSKILLHNIAELGIQLDSIDKIVFSHGHFDHTLGLPGLLDTMTPEQPIPVFGHPLMREKKVGKMAFIKKKLGFPELNEKQLAKIEFHLTKEPVELAKGLTTTGEIATRPHRDGTEPNAFHLVNHKLVVDPVLDDQSLVIDGADGLVIITGCCHAGLLNTLEHARRINNKPVKAIIGGTHMVRFSESEVQQVADVLEKDYDLPDLHLNHCTDKIPVPFVKKTPVTKILKKRFGEEKVRTCHVGTELSYSI